MLKIFLSFVAGYLFCKYGGWDLVTYFFDWLSSIFSSTYPYIDSVNENLRVFFTDIFNKIFR